MATYYSVVQYVPDALAGERINIGVIACDERSASAQFLNDWRRVRCFSGNRDVTFLREFAQRVSHQVEPLPMEFNGAAGHQWNSAYLEELSKEWGNSIQFSPPRASLQPAEALVDSLAEWYLQEALEVRARQRDKRYAVRVAAETIRDTVALKLGRVPSRALHHGYPVEGRLETQVLDLVAATRHTLCGIQALSFEIRDLRDLRSDLGAAKWAISDVRQRNPDLTLALVHLPPPRGENAQRGGQVEMYHSAQETMQKIGVDFIPADHLAEWADRMVERTLPEWREWLDYARP